MSTSAGGPKIADLLRAATARLRRAGVESPRLESQLLLAELIGIDRGRLLARAAETLSDEALREYDSRVGRRAGREPYQHIIGSVEFHGLQFLVDARALIPRPETELLVDVALTLGLPESGSVVDLGTGSGCIAVALAVRRPAWRVTAVDRSVAALDLARSNGLRHGVDSRIDWLEADFAALPGKWRDRFDLVLSNPPYVAAEEWRGLEPEVRDHEPREALVPGPSGLEVYELLAAAGRKLLHVGGFLVLEVGFGQADHVAGRLGAAGFHDIRTTIDFQEIPRVVQATRGPGGDDDHGR